MKAQTVLKHLVQGSFAKILHPSQQATWSRFMDIAIKRGAFVVVLRTKCGCSRVMHYTVTAPELILKPGQPFGKVVYNFELNVHFPKLVTECGPMPIPQRYADLPLTIINVPAGHEYVDASLQALIEQTKRMAPQKRVQLEDFVVPRN